MSAPLRQALSALGVFAFAAVAIGAAAATAISIRDAQANVASLTAEIDALAAREKRLVGQPGRELGASPQFEAKTITLAAAGLQQRLEAAIATAKGRLVSSKVELETRTDARRVALSAELTIAAADMQSLLFDLETGRPYLFVDAIEARASDPNQGGEAMRVSLTVSGEWSGAK